MKTLLFLALFSSCLPGHSAERDIGTILGKEDRPPEKSDITVSYVYDGKGQLFLTLWNIAMNAAARGVGGSVALHKAAILIHPKERFDAEGAVESLGWYSIRYVIPKVKPGIYTLVHDDTAADGQDRVARTVLDLTKATKGSVTISFKDPAPEKAPEAVPSPRIEPEVVVPAEGETPAE
jgi:hypothetical protein